MNEDIYEEVVKLKRQGKKAALATIITAAGSTPRGEGSKMLVKEDGKISGSVGGGKLEAMVVKEALKTIVDGKTKTFMQFIYFGTSKAGTAPTSISLSFMPSSEVRARNSSL